MSSATFSPISPPRSVRETERYPASAGRVRPRGDVVRPVRQRSSLPMSDGDLRARLGDLLRFAPPPTAPEVQTLGRRAADGYAEHLVQYAGHAGARVPAFLLLPD